jgi:hypothetical protein
MRVVLLAQPIGHLGLHHHLQDQTHAQAGDLLKISASSRPEANSASICARMRSVAILASTRV